MKYQSGTRRQPQEYEKDLIRYWQENQTFEKSVEQRPKEKNWVFYDGPPFLTGAPHHGHLLVSALKDAVARFWTMQGHRVERRWGWDCHGLPAEVFVEKQLGVDSKQEIGTKISVSEYVNSCRAAMVKTGTEWEDTIARIGRWVEFKGAYQTMDNEFMESVWWAFKELYEADKIYESEKILVYCTKDATPISKSEVAMENSYQMVTDPSVYVYFKLEDVDEYLLAWTTTPWTLPANVAIAVNSQLEYSLVEYNEKRFYIASEVVERVMTDEKHQPLDYKIIKNISGRDLVGKSYEPLFEYRGEQAHRVLEADFVTTESGSGIVHEAPAYGEEDYELCQREGVPMVSMVDENGNYTEGRWQGRNIWEVNKEIAKTLMQEGLALKIDYIEHEYPHCHRCGTKLMYRAHPSWFLDIQSQKDEMLKANESTTWVPGHLKTGRFRHILETAPDWNLSRDRYWATPIPVWTGKDGDGEESVKVIGSYDEFEELTGLRLDDYHLPNVMDIEFELDGVKYRHIGKVLDCWFESGSMPFAQFHYPFENKEKFESSFPADFITEAIDQTRGWFYSLNAVNVGLFGESPYKNLISTGHINGADGKKLSKKLGNYTDPVELMDTYSADAFRFLMLSSPLANGENFALVDKDVGDVHRKLNMAWNMYDFFTMYAEVDGWEWGGGLEDPTVWLDNPLDIWAVSRVHETLKYVDEQMHKYDIPRASKPILELISDLSNWYVRRSRKRFWRSDDDSDKQAAYTTLHYSLVQMSYILAPFTPFLAEELFHKLTNKESIHLQDWPEVGAIDQQILDRMRMLREVISEGLAQRSRAGIKVRQPLGSIYVKGSELGFLEEDEDGGQFYADILHEELNVKAYKLDISSQEFTVEIDTDITPQLHREGMAREVIRHVQQHRKKAQFQVDDRISLKLVTDSDDLSQAIEEHASAIKQETLATELATTGDAEEKVDVSGKELRVSISKNDKN